MNRRLAVPLFALGSLTIAQGQGVPYPPIGSAVRHLLERDVIQRVVPDPLQPSGFPGLEPKNQTLPEAQPVDPTFRLENANESGRDGNRVTGTGDVEFWYKGYHVFADEMEGDLQTSIFTLTGNVRVIGKDTTITGDRVTVNFDNETYLSQNAESQVGPELVKGQVQDDLYIKARESYGSERNIWAHGAELTTCNLDEPHYHLDAADAEIRPGKRAILRHTKVKLFGKTVLSLPYLSIPLDDKTYRYTPQFGQSEDEGYFVKTRYPIPLRGGNNFDSRIDHMTKLGTGLGGDYRYFNPSINGTARIYAILGQANTFTLNNDHRQQFRFGTLSLTNDFQKNNYLTAPGTTLINTAATFALTPRGGGNTRLSFRRNGSNSSGFSTLNQNFAIADQRQFGRSTRTNLDVNWLQNKTEYQGQEGNDREQIDVRFRGSHDMNKALANFEYLRTIPVGETQGIFGSSDRTPYLALQSDARRLMGTKFADRLPFNTELSFGEFGTSTPTADHVSRYNFDFRFNKPDRSDRRLKVDVAGQFRQGMYSDDTAQYTNGASANASYRLGHDTSANFRYNYLRQHGYTPLQIDRVGRTNLFSADLTYRPLRPLLVGVQSSYDFLRLERRDIAWQSVGVRTEYQPRENFIVRTYSNYDTFQQSWSNIRLDVAYRHNDQFIALGARYDGLRKMWSNANLYLQNFKWGRINFGATLSYNGFTKQFDAMQYSLIYDLHCAEAIVVYTQQNTGFRSGRDVQFFIRLKALPFDLPIGFGTRGQPLGSPTGYGF